MSQFIAVAVIIFAVFGMSFLMINLRQIVTGNEFRGTCASNNPMLKDDLGECTLCGKKPDEECQMPEVDTSKT